MQASHPLNPTGDEVELRYRLADSGGYRRSDSSQYRVLTGLKGGGAAARYTTPVGKLDLSSNATYLTELRIFSATLNGGSYGDNLAGRYDSPKLVANAAATLETGAFSNGLGFTYNSATKLQGDYYDDDYTLAGCASRGWSASECRVDAFARWDYAFSYKGIKNLTLSVFVRNLLDQRPPVDLKAFNRDGGGVIPQSRADVQGRSLRLTAEYKFF